LMTNIDCLRMQFPADPLRCAEAVAAFSKCAKQAYQV